MSIIPWSGGGSSGFQLTSQKGAVAFKMAHAPLRSYIMTDHKRKIDIIDLNKDLEASAARLEELKAGRHVDDIPLDDEYWKALKKHRKAFK